MPRPRPAAPPAVAPGRRVPEGRGAAARALALVVAVTLAPGVARAGEPPAAGDDLTEQTGDATSEVSQRTGPAEVDGDLSVQTAPGAEEATRWTAEGQRRRTAGDLDGAIEAWQRATAVLPVTQATAHRRAGLALAVAAAHAEAARARPERMRRAIAVLDAYLAGLDPTDDENRVAVEQRRAELAARLGPDPTVTPTTPAPAPPRRDRRLLVAGGVGLGLGAAGLTVLAAGLLAGARADRELAAAVELPGDDPRREPDKDAAWARGLRANRAAIAGGVLGGVLLVAGLALTIAGVVRRPPRRAALTPTLAPGGLRWAF
ncbi:MAG TPA: hypothetical protein VGB85_25425 [Nannocystis sp.]